MAFVAGRGSTESTVPGGVGLAWALVVVSIVSLVLWAGRTVESSATQIAGVSTSGVKGQQAPVTLIGHTRQQAQSVDQLIDRFTTVGLDLPPLTITFWPSREECAGMGGRHRGLGEIEVCIPTPRMIAHEMAHAWEAHTLTDAQREAYRRLWGAPTWNSDEFEWHQRAIELAANTVAFGVLNDDPEPFQQILMYLCTFEDLTGRPLPTPTTTPCPEIGTPGSVGD